LKGMEENKLIDYAFRNNGDLTFENVSAKWGIREPDFSSGAAYADLDNDGDLDLLVNRLGDPFVIYRNTLNEQAGEHHYLKIKVTGPASDRSSLGTKVKVYVGGKVQLATVSPYKGFQSTVDKTLHFGLGGSTSPDSVVVVWTTGEESVLKQVPV